MGEVDDQILKTPERPSKSVYETILGWISDGTLKPGDPINEVAISRKLGVSRTPVREAIATLIGDDLIEEHANRRRSVVKLSASDILEIFEIRLLLEAKAARLAASRIDRQTLHQLRNAFEQLGSNSSSSKTVSGLDDFDEFFHNSISAACGNTRLALEVTRFRRMHKALNTIFADEGSIQQARTEHIKILEALEQRDADAAEQAMSDHINEWKNFYVRVLSD